MLLFGILFCLKTPSRRYTFIWNLPKFRFSRFQTSVRCSIPGQTKEIWLLFKEKIYVCMLRLVYNGISKHNEKSKLKCSFMGTPRYQQVQTTDEMLVQTRGKSLLKIAYVIFVILKSHDFFSVIFCDFSDF